MHSEAVHFTWAMRTEGAEPYWLTFAGSSGTGKSLLARHINKHAVFPRLPAIGGGFYKITWNCVWEWKSDILDRLLAGEYGIRRKLAEDHFVVLDDIGSEREQPTDFAIGELFGILNKRVGKWTVLTVNLPLEAIARKYDARISSRLIQDGNVCVKCDTMNYRFREQQDDSNRTQSI